MARGLVGTIGSAVTLAVTVFICARGVGSAGIPPFGPLLDPVQGAAAAVRYADLPRSEAQQITSLGANVRVLFDTRGVPHVYASNTRDAYRALGYAIARDRYFQMELTYRAASGTLTELVGARALSLDKEARRLGLGWAAERKWAALDTTSEGRRAMQAFADGVNAYRATMTPASTPIEYKLLGATPMAHWEPRYSVYLLMRMALTLAYNPDDLRRTRVAALVGRDAANALFPRNAPIQEPIQPVPGRTAPREEWVAIPAPGAPDTSLLAPASAASVLEHTALAMPGAEQTGDALGSNNWAIAPTRTASGGALLSGDPHLDLSLPSIWYEAHLVVKDSLDVYGVTFPGSPTIVIGFNKDVAWTFTNTGGDVADYFLEEVDNPTLPTKYRLDGAWQQLVPRIETFHNPAGRQVGVDTVYYTHRGPTTNENGRLLSFRWTAHDASNELDGFVAATRARNVQDWQQAMLPYKAPTQNMLVADRNGTIALRSLGEYPMRRNGEEGSYVRDGRTRASDWIGMLPVDDMPQVMNPAQGFIVSANQQPFDPRVVSRYIGSNWPDPWRALRINEILRADDKVTPERVRQMQMDPLNVRARMIAPYFVRAAERSGNASLGTAAKMLRDWDYRYSLPAQAPVLFEAAMKRAIANTWDELRATPGTPPIAVPASYVYLELLRDSTSIWWDDRRTAGTTETRDALLADALATAFDSLTVTLGPVGLPWEWGLTGGINVRHLANLPGFSREHLAVTSGYGTIAPASGANSTHGASWRMIVELTKNSRTAWAIYPGGQSGNPASRRYDDRLEKWRTGQLDSLVVPESEAAFAQSRLLSILELRP
ncbi:MAG: penicillin acylase family protein [Gemmatimonadaceae bacterium]|nr:penicillin acylase family protein [Gemmatimonadaceae bacterium]